MLNRKTFESCIDSRQLFGGYGSFGEVYGTLAQDNSAITLTAQDYQMTCAYEQDAYGIYTRQDTFQNCSDSPITIRNLKSRFVFEGGEYQVYTQFNSWQDENKGAWQELNTAVSVGSESVRTCQDATPFLVLWSQQESRGVAFHLLPNCNWEMTVTRVRTTGKRQGVVVELGISSRNLALTLSPGEIFRLPQILCYTVSNKMHLDCYKLHNYLHTRYPRQQIPVLYNTWLGFFDQFSFEKLMAQIPLAAELGVEYFFLDAGWFGTGEVSWGASVGDWFENPKTLGGRMGELADAVRAAGMKFGLWLEPERATLASQAYKEHPEYYLPITGVPRNVLLDFANPEARTWMLNIVCNLIDRFGVRYIKDDFNMSKYYCQEQDGFLAYHAGHEAFLKELKCRYPDLYLSSCAAGGLRMELQNYKFFDSSWPSDNQNIYAQMEMYRHALLRLPPQAMERWAAIHSLMGMKDFYKPFASVNRGNCERMVVCADGTWSHIVGIQQSFLEGFFTGGPVGLSCDLTKVSEKTRAELKRFIAEFKANREFWLTAVARILCDTKTVSVYQYSDMALNKIVIQLFTKEAMQDSCRVYPELDASKNYRYNGKLFSGAALMEEGICISLLPDMDDHYQMFQVDLIGKD